MKRWIAASQKKQYADGCDIITEIEKAKDKIYQKAKEIMKSKNMLVNDKTGGNRMEKCDKTGIKAW